MLYRACACVQRYMYKRNTVHSIPCQQCPKKYVGQTTSTIKRRCSENRNWCQKKHKKKIFKLQRRKLELLFIIDISWNGIRYWFLESVTSNYCRRKAYQLEKADNVNRRDRDKKAQPKEHTYRWDVKLTPFGTPLSNLSKPDRHGGWSYR